MPGAAPFEYPTEPHIRRHGPAGYSDYESYRDWLRDEFSFRCVFCLWREQWPAPRSIFHIDHLIPRLRAPHRVCDYDNLVYTCAGCNGVKGDLQPPDPCAVGFGRCVSVNQDGSIKALNEEGVLLIETLNLDDEDCRRYRRLMLEIIQLCGSRNRRLFRKLLGYPDNLPDLSGLRPPSNTRPEGVARSFFAKRKRGELPETY